MESEASVQPQPEESSETVEQPEAHVRESVETEMQIDSDEHVHEPVSENATESNSNSVSISSLETYSQHVLTRHNSHNQNQLLHSPQLQRISSKV